VFSSYESIIATLCESLDTLDEPEAKVQILDDVMVYVIVLTRTYKLHAYVLRLL